MYVSSVVGFIPVSATYALNADVNGNHVTVFVEGNPFYRNIYIYHFNIVYSTK